MEKTRIFNPKHLVASGRWQTFNRKKWKMKIRNFIIFSFLILLISCKKEIEKTESKKVNTKLNQNKEIGNLTYNQFKNSKWIIGEIGLNGEKPDTIIFDNPKMLTYISTDTGKENCKYSFVKDTLIYTSYSTEFDSESEKEIISESISKFHFQNNMFKFIFCDQKKSTEKKFRRTNMEKYNLLLRKI